MKATVEQSDWKPGRSSDEELSRLTGQMRGAMNARYSAGPFTLTTAATATLATIWTSDDIPTNAAWEVDALVVGISSDGLQAARYHLSALFRRASGGSIAQVGATSAVVSIEDAAGFNAAFTTSGNAVLLQVRDDGVSTMNWSAHIEGRRVP